MNSAQLNGGNLPDIALLTQLANSFFRAGFLSPPGPESVEMPAPPGSPDLASLAGQTAHPAAVAGAADYHAPDIPPGFPIVPPSIPLVGPTTLLAPGTPEVPATPGELPPTPHGRAPEPPEIKSPAPAATTAPPPEISAGLDVLKFRPVLEPQPGQPRPFDPNLLRRDFPILQERVHGQRLLWLDNAATTQKPRTVIDRLTRYYEHENSNVHRAAHTLAARSTDAYEDA